ncbi:hypothetical protein TrCOL_g347 [Triparma columacea]|uniref:SSD domain-containing protein n=1 Tax=Triparma columacea TaxID=722753 RepID=A0A9W7GIH1_9STRA|nr:hypothetical protein TrCOL_g347 [Triparma columacea]
MGNPYNDALAEAIGADIPLVGAAYLVMIIVCCCSLGRGVMDGCGRSSIALAGGGVMTVFLSTLAGFGISAACGAWFTSLHSLLPFILLGIGVDDMYVLVNAFLMTRESLDLEDRVAIACRNAGVPILYTSLTDFVAFLLGSTSSLKGISSFCVYAAVAVLFDFFLQVTMFVAIMVMDERRRQANLMDCCCCIPLSKEGVEKREKHRFSTVQTEEFYNKPKEQCVEKVSTVHEFFELYATKISKFAVPILVLFAGMFAVGIWGSTEATEGFDANKLVLDSSHFRSYNTMNKDYKMSTFESMAPVFIYVKDIPYHEAAYQKKVLDLTESATNLEYTSGPSTIWLKDFLTYLATQGDICSGSCDYSSTGVDVAESVFNTKLAAFLAESDYKKYTIDISLNSEGGIDASRSMVWHDRIDGVKQQVNAMEEIVKLCDDYTGFGDKVPFADSWIYVYVYQFVIFFSELMTNFGLVLVAVLIVSPIVLKQPVATFMLIVTVAMIDTELFGMIHIYGDNVNSFTGLGLIMAVGLAVDYNAHIIHAFFSNDPELDRHDRLRLTMKQMGKSVALGGLTTLCGLLPLAGSQCEVFRVFCKMTLAIIILGLMQMLKETYFPGECERNTVDFGYLNVSLVFRDFGRTIVSIGVAFFMKDPQEIFAYVIQLADQPKYDEIANKRLIFALFFSYYITMILFIFNFVTAEIMQLSDLLGYNMLHQVEIDFLKPNNSNFVYCIEWKLNVTSRRGAMIIEYYTKRLNDASDERLDDSDEESYSTSDENENSGAEGGIEADTHWERGESMGSRNSVGSPCRESRFMKRSTIGGKTVTVTKQIKRSGTSWVKERAEDEDGVELQEVRLTDNPLNNASPSMRSRLSTGGSSSVGVRNQGEAKATQLSRSSSRARRQSTLELLPTLVKSRKLPHGEVWVDPRRQRSSSKNRPSLQSMSVDERARYEEKKARTYAKQYSGIPYPPSEAYPDHLKGEWEKNLKFVSGEG